MKLPTINKEFLPIKGHFFLYNAGLSPVLPFMPVFAKQLGFSSSVVGTIYTILPISGTFIKPLMGGIADRFKIHKWIFFSFMFLMALAHFAIQFIPEVPELTESRVGFACGHETSLYFCTEHNEGNFPEPELSFTSQLSESTRCLIKCHSNSDVISNLCTTRQLSSQFCAHQTFFSTAPKEMSEESNWKGRSGDLSTNFDYEWEFTALVSSSYAQQVGNCSYFPAIRDDPSDSLTVLDQCQMSMHSVCTAKCSGTGKSTEVNVTSLYQFWELLIFLFGSWIGMSVTTAFSDAICSEILGAERGHLYGNQRLWGSAGWGFTAIFAGLIVDAISSGDEKKNYTPLFYLMVVFLTADVICCYYLKYDFSAKSPNILKDVGKLLRNPRIDIFMIWCVYIGMCQGLQMNFLFWYLEDLAAAQGEETWIKTLEGFVNGVECFLGEVPFFFLSGYIVKKIGYVHTMTLALFILAVRYSLYSILVNPWYILPIELLQAAYGLYYSIMVTYASVIAPPGTEATVQGIVGALFEGVGVSIGSLLGGIFFDQFGGDVCFRIFGITSLVMSILHAAAQFTLDRISPLTVVNEKESTVEEAVNNNHSDGVKSISEI